MYDEKKEYVIAFNGEIYNFKSIRQELIKKGYSFFSKSDTEVVLKSYIEWGSECLSKFTGMFAFIIVDLNKDKVFVARDQLGIKPLYFYQDDRNIFFASEIKCFRNCTKLDINKDALYEQFYFRYVSGMRTIFKNIYRLEAGNFLEFDKRAMIKQKKYYDVIDSVTQPNKKNIDMDLVEQILGESIISHTSSDVGYNIQLSGGIDSSYLVANLSEEYKHKVNTYSAELTGYEYDEAIYQNYVSNKYCTNHYGYGFGFKDYINNLEKTVWHLDFPIYGGGSAPYLMLLNRRASSSSKVMLAGEGADELFLGYDHYSYPIALSHIFKRYGLDEKMSHDVWDIVDFKEYFSVEIEPSEEVFLTQYDHMSYFNDLERNIGNRVNGSRQKLSLLKKIIIADQTSWLQSRFEVQDRMGMAASVEVRVPYCIPKLFEVINSFYDIDKITPFPKKILKKISEKYFDDGFIYRDKIGFRMPFASWLKDRYKMKNYLDLLTDNVFRQRDYYNTEFVRNAVDDHISGKRDNSGSLIYIINFEIWHRMFIDDNPRYAS